ncbi:hypothetical protein BKA70DRAFT_1520540 [Coprinopsis sp. MPI-PUGE-AT-0042]|nr:hypothetical protein BKA70DRAFT_1520540 [Coprinopsis sp. MPI-PUGE-AT-0042]
MVYMTDGGGLRSVSPLCTLRKTMREVARMEGKEVVKTCEYFDLMARTSTGGLAALTLGEGFDRRMQNRMQRYLEEGLVPRPLGYRE